MNNDMNQYNNVNNTDNNVSDMNNNLNNYENNVNFENYVNGGRVKKSKGNPLIVLLILIILVLVGYIVYDKAILSSKVENNTQSENKNSNTSNNDNSNNKVETNKELDSVTKKELTDSQKADILKLIGLTDKGLERMKEEDVIADGLPSGDYAYCFGNNLSATFFSIKSGTYEINQLDMDTKKNIVRWGANALGLLDEIKISDDEETTCTAGSYCDGITESNFDKVISKYSIIGNIKDYFNDYDWQKRGNHYVYLMSGYVSFPCSISDNLTFEVLENKVNVVYDIKQDEVNGSNGYHLNKKITYSFKADNNFGYSLYQVKVEEK